MIRAETNTVAVAATRSAASGPKGIPGAADTRLSALTTTASQTPHLLSAHNPPAARRPTTPSTRHPVNDDRRYPFRGQQRGEEVQEAEYTQHDGGDGDGRWSGARRLVLLDAGV